MQMLAFPILPWRQLGLKPQIPAVSVSKRCMHTNNEKQSHSPHALAQKAVPMLVRVVRRGRSHQGQTCPGRSKSCTAKSLKHTLTEILLPTSRYSFRTISLPLTPPRTVKLQQANGCGQARKAREEGRENQRAEVPNPAQCASTGYASTRGLGCSQG